ncbi:hypothetical protein CEE36_10320 [candidate division TA06 bacterium B3_TA06]|uniref:Dipeptidylpeptidase IV N-terminal domain-containing protein n=1 Tax=candidate division TA06 bacterium B3_TA06 TaxID=2012487 RepID=A0A532UW41_UNCT6|nr:MAG: hypothetical protein CEE36_10320 [candidate division TA06 bacterium B3_TA06]
MKRMWSVLGAGLIVGLAVTPLLSCNVIQGDLELLVDEQTSIYSPCWGPDGEYIYYLLASIWGSETGSLWVIDLETLETERITGEEQEIPVFDLSPDGSEICFARASSWLYFIRTEDGSLYDSLLLDSVIYYISSNPPRFSRQDPDFIYYLSTINDSILLHQIKRSDESDKVLLSLPRPEHITRFNISCDGSRVLIGDTIYSLKGNTSVSLDRKLGFVDWHPTDPDFLVGTMADGWLCFYDLSEDKWSKAKVNPYKPSINAEVRFSPDGERIAVTSKPEGGEFTEYALWFFDPSN